MAKHTSLADLNDLLWEQMEAINNEDLTGEALTEQLSKTEAIVRVAGTVMANANLILSARKFASENAEILPKLLTGEQEI